MRKPLPAPDPLLRLQASITARDDRLLGWLYDHGVLTTDQIATALFPSLDFAQRRLHRLTVLRAADRLRPNRAYGGSYPYYYVLDQLGYDHVHAQRGLAVRGGAEHPAGSHHRAPAAALGAAGHG
ncbi:replication-relaxation family protein [Micromonospora sp. SL1-18]|uniref:replication-relaxation family protein n=1 Tax=Micromonospora sp. SL1-18 TaxID=3399128 RepID=UPI003A4E36F9